MRFCTSLGTDIDDYNNISLAIDINKLLVPTPPAIIIRQMEHIQLEWILMLLWPQEYFNHFGMLLEV